MPVIKMLITVAVSVSVCKGSEWGWHTLQGETSDEASYDHQIMIMDPELLSPYSGSVTRIRYFTSDSTCNYRFYILTPLPSGDLTYKYVVREKSSTLTTYLRHQETHRTVSDVIKVEIGDILGFEFPEKIPFTYSDKFNCIEGVNTYRVYNRTEFGNLYKGDEARFTDNPAAECKEMSYVLEINEEQTGSSWGSWDSWNSENDPSDKVSEGINWPALYISVPVLLVLLCLIPVVTVAGYRAKHRSRIGQRVEDETRVVNHGLEPMPGSSQPNLRGSLRSTGPKPVHTPRGYRHSPRATRIASIPMSQPFPGQHPHHLSQRAFYEGVPYPYMAAPMFYPGPPPPYTPMADDAAYPPPSPSTIYPPPPAEVRPRTYTEEHSDDRVYDLQDESSVLDQDEDPAESDDPQSGPVPAQSTQPE